MFAFDVIEEILVRSDAKDLVPWKRVCKSWYSLISSHRFAKAHLKKKMATSNVELRIAMPSYWKIPANEKYLYERNKWKVAGASNGLVCFYRTDKVSLLLLCNPWTREIKKLPMWPLDSECEPRDDVCLGFGYDSSTDDYKVFMEIQKDFYVALIQVFSLRSNTWKLIGEFNNYRFVPYQPGILLHGALHWLVSKDEEKTLISFDLSSEELIVFPEPNHPRYEWHCRRRRPLLGIVDDQLWLFFLNFSNLPSEIWVMRSYNVQHSWEVLPKNYEKLEVVHHMKMAEFPTPNNKRMTFFCDDKICLSRYWSYIGAPRLVPSLVSPYAAIPSHTKNNKTSVKSWSIQAVKGEGQHSHAMVKRTIVDPSEQEERQIEERCRQEFGETQNLYLHEDDIRKIRSDVAMDAERRIWREEQRSVLISE